MSKIENNRILPVQDTSGVKKSGAKPPVSAPSVNQSGYSVDTADKGDFKTEKPGTRPEISFIGENADDLDNALNNNIGKTIKEFSQDINRNIAAKKDLPPYVAKDIFAGETKIKELIGKGKLDSVKNIKKINEEFLIITRLLNSSGMLTPEIKHDLNKMVAGLLHKYGKDFGMQLATKSVHGVIAGLTVKTNNNKPLNDDQKKVLKEASFLVGETEYIKSVKTPLTANSLALMGMRQALLNRSITVATAPAKQEALDPQFKDLEGLSKALKTVDEMMSSTRDISPTLIADLEDTVTKMLNSPDGQISDVLNPVQDMGNQLKDAGKNLTDIKKNLEDAGSQIKSATDSGQIKDGTGSVKDSTKFIIDMINSAPYDLSDQVGKAIDSYSSVMNQVQSQMPTFPFPVSMPVPMTYNDGKGNSFVIPAGSKVTSDSKGFTIDGNGLMMTTGTTFVNAGKSKIRVGKDDIDKLAIDSLTINDNGKNSTLTNFDATINRSTGVSVIKADQADIDMSSGKVTLTNTSLTRAQDGSIKLNSDTFLYKGNNGDSTSLNAFNLEQSNTNGVSKINGSAKDIIINNSGNNLTADSMSFNMVKDSNNNTQAGDISAVNVNYISKNGNLKTDKATINYLTTPDGTTMNINTLNPEWTSDKDNLKVIGNANLSFAEDKDGNLTKMAAHGDQINYSGKDGKTAAVTNGNLDIDYNPNGSVKDLTASMGTLQYNDSSGQINSTGDNLNLKYDKDGKIQQINADVQTLNYVSKDGDNIDVTKGSTVIKYNDKGNLSVISGSAENIAWTGKNGDAVKAAGTQIDLNYNDDGKLKNASASVGLVNYLSKDGDKVDLTKGNISINYNDKGNIQNVAGSAETLNWAGKNGDSVNATGLNIGLNYSDDGTLQKATAGAGTVNYTGKNGDIVNATNGNASFNYNDKGVLTGVTGSIETLDWTGKNGDTLKATGTNVALDYGDNGMLKNASASVGTVNYVSNKGDKVDIVNGSANLTYDKDGKLTNASGSALLVQWTGKKGETLTGAGVNVSIDTSDPKNTKMAAGAAFLNYTKIDPDKTNTITVNATNTQITSDNKQLTAHVDSATFIQTMTKDLTEKYNVTVENVDLVVKKNDKGGVAEADLQVAGATAKIDDINVTVKTQNGDRVRLNVTMSKDGTYITNAFLQIPTGGEIKVEGKDYDVALGGNQKISFSQDGKGTYTFRDDGLNINASTKDAKVSVQGGSAQVSLDTKNGNIIIDQITGTNINIELKDGNTVNLDVQKIKDMMVAAGSFKTDTAKGFALYLRPNSDNATVSLVAKAKIEDIPVTFTLDNVHDFEASGYYTTNFAHVYIGDRSGKGNVELKSGPIKSYGSAIEFVARYNPYDTQRMLTSLNTLLTNDGTYLGKGFSVEPDGVIRVGTQFAGPHAELAVMLPHNYQNPYNITSSNIAKDDSFGIVASLGWKFKNKQGDKLTMDVNAGLVPGSYLSVDQLKGSTTVYGVPIPKSNAIPTTAIGGVTLRFETDTAKVNMTSGAYVNPAGLMKEPKGIPIISDNIKYGSYTGFSVTQSDSTYSAIGTLGITRDNKYDPGFRLGYSRKFGLDDIAKALGSEDDKK
jgi:single-stranded DNA-binding protein